MGTRRGQKPSLLLVVAGACQGVILQCVQDSVFPVWKIIHVTILRVSNRYCISLWFG